MRINTQGINLAQQKIDETVLNDLLRLSEAFFDFILMHDKEEISEAIKRYNEYYDWPEPLSLDLIVMNFLERDIIEGTASQEEKDLLNMWARQVGAVRAEMVVGRHE